MYISWVAVRVSNDTSLMNKSADISFVFAYRRWDENKCIGTHPTAIKLRTSSEFKDGNDVELRDLTSPHTMHHGCDVAMTL
mmetsp:Transcript_17974/g.51021  ORF Transcript_17974/g.51021 Transcript_17974/m.51021 type:complete len:81 (+) Transcript_17974:315-557(+)